MSNLHHLMTGLHNAGLPASCPVAVTRTRAANRTACTRVGTLTTIAELAAEMGSPAVIVIGEVVAWKHWCDATGGEVVEEITAEVFGETAMQSAFAR